MSADVPAELPDPLRRILSSRRRPDSGEACEFCAAPVGPAHRHVVDLPVRRLCCTCRACALLFLEPDAGRYRTVPEDHSEVTPLNLPHHMWARLQIPVGTAFVLTGSAARRTVAFYPGPGGATESELPLDGWSEVVGANPALAQVEPDVEAVLLRGGGSDATRCWIVGVDRCYELVGTLRSVWRGFDGGAEARSLIDAFFADVSSRCRPRPTAAAGAAPGPAQGGGHG